MDYLPLFETSEGARIRELEELTSRQSAHISELAHTNGELRYALDAAARSLESISKQAGIDEYMNEFCEVRGYAQSRAWSARKALASQPTPHNPDREDAERELLWRLVNAVSSSEFGGVVCLDIYGEGNWFDVRDKLIAARAGEGAWRLNENSEGGE